MALVRNYVVRGANRILDFASTLNHTWYHLRN